MRWRGPAEEAYEACVKEEEQVRLLEEAAAGKLDPGKLHSMFLSYEPRVPEMPATEAVLATIPASPHHPGTTYRLAGDRYRPRPLLLLRCMEPGCTFRQTQQHLN